MDDDEGIEKDHEEDESEEEGQQNRYFAHNFCNVLCSLLIFFFRCLSSLSSSCSIARVLSLCCNHLSVRSEAAQHFRAVCRALVSEALELSHFLQRTELVRMKAEETSEELMNLALQDWANLWVQTMSELRQGVKLKKTNYTKTPIEFELTPYEILMDDIRSRRYKLNKVMVDGEIPPKVKRDAHDIILEFIRSRPPLKPVSRRQLRPHNREWTPQERLMSEIRGGGARDRLRKTPGGWPEPKVHLGQLVKVFPTHQNILICRTQGDLAQRRDHVDTPLPGP